MAVESKIYDALIASTLITASATNRVYPLILPQEVAYPAISYFRLSEDPLYSFDGYLGKTNAVIRIDVYTTSYANTKTLAQNIRTVLSSASSVTARQVGSGIDLFEPRGNDGKDLYRFSMDFSVWGDN